MGVVFISSSAARSPLGLSSDLLTHRSSSLKKPSIVAFKADDSSNSALIIPREQVLITAEQRKEKRVVTRRKPCKIPKKPDTLDHNSAPSCSLGVDYNEAAARLESIYKLSPATSVEEDEDCSKVKVSPRRKRKENGEEKVVVRNNSKKEKRMSLEKRIALKRNTQEKPVIASSPKKVPKRQQEEEKIERLVRDYSASNDVVDKQRGFELKLRQRKSY